MRRLANILTLLFHMTVSIGVGRCSDLGGRHFFKQQKCDFLEEQCLHAIIMVYNTAMKFVM